jgi:hypothetical protein
LAAISPGFVHIFAARSGCAWSIPVSITATIVPAPFAVSHALAASIVCRPQRSGYGWLHVPLLA